MPVDGELLEVYKVFKGCATDTELANLLGIKRQSISMVRSGRNKLRTSALLKIFEDVMDVGHLGLQTAVQSSDVDGPDHARSLTAFNQPDFTLQCFLP